MNKPNAKKDGKVESTSSKIGKWAPRYPANPLFTKNTLTEKMRCEEHPDKNLVNMGTVKTHFRAFHQIKPDGSRCLPKVPVLQAKKEEIPVNAVTLESTSTDQNQTPLYQVNWEETPLESLAKRIERDMQADRM